MDQAKLKANIEEAFSDKNYVTELLGLETPEEVKSKLAEKDIDLSVDEIKQIKDLIVKREEGELTDEELENVSGGVFAEVICFIGGLTTLLVSSSVTVLTVTRTW